MSCLEASPSSITIVMQLNCRRSVLKRPSISILSFQAGQRLAGLSQKYLVGPRGKNSTGFISRQTSGRVTAVPQDERG